ncbi:MAG: F0F1 ATP synthase subunit B [Opitutales bacterium]
MKAFTLYLLLACFLPFGIFVASGADSFDLVHASQNLAEGEAETNALTEIATGFGVTLPTLIAQMINFTLVAVVLYFFAVKPIAKTLDERQQKIADGLQYAEEMKTQLAEAERERAERIKQAAQDAQRILSEAREQSKEMIEHKTQEAAAQAEAIFRKASEATELERQKMLSDVRQEVARLVVATTSTVLSKELSDADKQTFSDAAARELASSVN